MSIIRSKSDELYTIKQNKTSFDDDKRYLLVETYNLFSAWALQKQLILLYLV